MYGWVPADSACEILHKAFPRKRQGVAKETTIEVGLQGADEVIAV
jgi:hypothetical protein